MQDQLSELHFPKAGIDLSGPFYRQMPREMPGGEFGRTCRDAVNVRTFDSLSRARGGQRCGLARFIDSPVVAGWIIQCLDVVVYNDPLAQL